MRLLIGILAVLAGCAAQQPAIPEPAAANSLLPGTIGVMVRKQPAGIVVAAVKDGGSAAQAGVRQGDLVVRFNGTAVGSPREFNRLVADSRPGSRAEIELLREGALRQVEVWVRQLDTMPRI